MPHRGVRPAQDACRRGQMRQFLERGRASASRAVGGRSKTMSITTLLALAVALAPTSAPDLSGRWSGRMEPTNLSAEVELELQRDGTAWKGALTFRAGPDHGSLPVEGLRIEGDSLSLRTRIEGAEVQLELALEDDLLLGSVRASEGGKVLAEGPVGLARASDEQAKTRLTRWLDAQGAALTPGLRAAVIEGALRLLLANYIFLERAERAVADVHERVARGEYDSLTNAARLAETLGRSLAESTGDK